MIAPKWLGRKLFYGVGAVQLRLGVILAGRCCVCRVQSPNGLVNP